MGAHMNWDFQTYLPVIACMEGADNPVTTAKECLSALSKVPYSAVKACAWGAEGNALMHAVANRTESLDPAHKYVPWIVVDGVHAEEVEQRQWLTSLALFAPSTKAPNPSSAKLSTLPPTSS